jgi:hypothetical protein
MMTRLALAGGAVLAGCLGSVALAPSALAAPRLPAGHASAYSPSFPVTITVRTVPALAGVRFAFDGKVMTTDGRGEASRTEQHNFSRHTLSLVDTRIRKGDRQYRFVRWAGQRDPNQAFRPTVRGLPMRANYTVTAAFAVRCPVSPRLFYQSGPPIDPAQIPISPITVRSDTGLAAKLNPAGSTWLTCQTPIYRGSTIISQPLKYSVQSVETSGTNVVHAGREQFWPLNNASPAIKGYFYDLRITAHDALFGKGTGSEAIVTLPNGLVRRAPFGADHTAILPNLPQGYYQVKVKAGASIVSAQSIRLSRDETVNLTAVSALDLAVIGGALAVAVAGLPFLSRARRRRVMGRLRRLRKEAVSA